MNFKITPFLLFFVILIVLSLSMVVSNISLKEGAVGDMGSTTITTPTSTTRAPTTPASTTMAPTTPAATTMAPTTPAATTMAPTTPAATTMAPTTPAATTRAPTTPATTTPACKNVVPEEIKCGDDMACKWYWYFKKRDSSGNQYLTEDYLLKTQIVPPVCPSCPSCPSAGVCTNCGGSGGSGTSGSYTGKDSSGNKYVVDKSSVVGTDANGNIILNTPKNMTVADYYGNYATTADPDTIGGGLTISGLAFGAGFQGIARDVVDITTDTTGKVGKGLEYVGGGVGNAASGVGGFVDKAASGVGGFIDKSVTGVGNFVGNALNSTGNLITDTSGRLVSTNASGGQYNDGSSRYGGNNNRNNTGVVGGGSQGSSTNYQSGANVGKVDNYSYYGALQSKGGNFMPVTSDFSKFGR